MDRMVFTAPAIRGSGRGKRIGVPTVNVDVSAVPTEVQEGIYACRCRLDDETSWRDAAMHFGPRPVFKDSASCELHLLADPINFEPGRAEVEVVEYLRPIMDFPSTEALMAQIADDVSKARAILGA